MTPLEIVKEDLRRIGAMVDKLCIGLGTDGLADFLEKRVLALRNLREKE